MYIASTVKQSRVKVSDEEIKCIEYCQVKFKNNYKCCVNYLRNDSQVPTSVRNLYVKLSSEKGVLRIANFLQRAAKKAALAKALQHTRNGDVAQYFTPISTDTSQPSVQSQNQSRSSETGLSEPLTTASTQSTISLLPPHPNSTHQLVASTTASTIMSAVAGVLPDLRQVSSESPEINESSVFRWRKSWLNTPDDDNTDSDVANRIDYNQQDDLPPEIADALDPQQISGSQRCSIFNNNPLLTNMMINCLPGLISRFQDNKSKLIL
ncbi:unnamed protein product [Didymodactylos carnosus]|uniref:Uncharacterized protein n=1 Tax=Didymodactylos carnosus TaxID=1234261 RepID=A0A8S2FJX7_9BILA|nr:unnamed protein product [Didymodactylos carnosus]CAF4281921.1 unnamed protein product [Didymodactylos carnosus]